MVCRAGVLCGVLLGESAWSMTITPPASQRVEPGQWVSVQFVVEPASVRQLGDTIIPQLKVPLNWSLLVESKPRPSQSSNTPWVMTWVVEVPNDASPGEHELVLTLGEHRSQATIEVRALGRLAFRDKTARVAPNSSDGWWGHAPWSHRWMLHLEGNMTQTVTIQVKASDGFKANVSPPNGSVSAGRPLPVEVELAVPSNGWPGRRVSVVVMALNDEGDVLAQAQTSVVLKGQRQQAHSMHWPVRVYGQSMLGRARSGRQEDNAFGLSGGGLLPWAGQPSLEFSLHSQSHRPFRVAYRGQAVQWSVGRQGFGDPVLSWMRRWGEGVSWQWQPSIAVHHRRLHLGLNVFEDHTTRYWQPSIGWGPWQASVWSIDALGVNGIGQNHRGVRLGYQNTPGPEGAWQWDLAYHARRWAGSMQWRKQTPTQSWHLSARVVPKDHPSQAPAHRYIAMAFTQRLVGERRVSARIDQHSRVADGGFRRSGSLVFDQPVSGVGLGRMQWGLHLIDSSHHPNPVRAFVGWRARHPHWQWHTRLETTGLWQARVQWRPDDQWRGYVHHKTRLKSGLDQARWGFGFEGQVDARWQWSVGWMHQEPPIIEPLKRSETMARHTPTNRLHVLITRLWGQGHRLSLSVDQSNIFNTDDAHLDRRVWMRYQWQGQLEIPMASQQTRGELIGEVVMQTPSGNIGLPGVVVEAQGQTTTTDALGRYRFMALNIGQAQVRLDPSSLQSNHLTVEDGAQTIDIYSGQAQRLNWTVFEAGAVDGQVLWPAQSPQPAQFDGLVLGFVCVDCPGVVSRQWAPVASSGHFQVRGLMPGRWQVAIVSGDLPAEHHWPALTELEVRPNKTVQVSWLVDYRPWPIHWSSEVPIPVDGRSP